MMIVDSMDWGKRSGGRPRKYYTHCPECGAEHKEIRIAKKKICAKCHYRKYGKSEARKMAQKRANQRKLEQRGYTVVDGQGLLQDGAFLTWTQVHTYDSELDFWNGTILRRNRDGKIYEVKNKVVLYELGEDDEVRSVQGIPSSTIGS